MKKVYIIGIAGKATSSMAKMFLDMGWEVGGSDQNVWPPNSTYLDRLGIKYHTSYNAENLQGEWDLVVVGGNAFHVDKENPEVAKARSMGFKVVSFPEVLEEFIVKKNSIVPVGTYGKTTTTAILSWVLEKNGLNPSFMIGAIPLNFESGIKRQGGEWSVIEGDEHPTLGYSPLAKFTWYHPTLLLFTSCSWDHINIYPTYESYLQVFRDLVKRMPSDGVIVACLDGESVQDVVKEASCRVVTYSAKSPQADYFAENLSFDSDFTRFTVQGELVESPLLGEANVENVVGCVAVAHLAGISTAGFSQALKSFKGINRRLEVVGTYGGVTVIDDHAHSPIKAQASLKAVKTRYKGGILAVFDPSSSALKERESLAWYPGMFDEATEVIITQIPRHKGVTSGNRVLGSDIVASIAKTQPNVTYQPVDDKVVADLSSTAKSGDVIIFMSSGDWRGMIEKTVEGLKR